MIKGFCCEIFKVNDGRKNMAHPDRVFKLNQNFAKNVHPFWLTPNHIFFMSIKYLNMVIKQRE